MINEVILDRLVKETQMRPLQIENTLKLLEDKCTVPFIARYRKEATEGLDEVEILTIKERSEYLEELLTRKESILTTIETQGKLTDELRSRIIACWQKTELEDLYLPYKPKRRTRATIAKERGLEALSEALYHFRIQGEELEEVAAKYIDPRRGVETKETSNYYLFNFDRNFVINWFDILCVESIQD